MTEDLKELETIRRLIQTTDKILASIERGMPVGPSWLGWRIAGQRRRLEEAQRAVRQLAEEMQIEVFRQVVEKPVERPQPPRK